MAALASQVCGASTKGNQCARSSSASLATAAIATPLAAATAADAATTDANGVVTVAKGEIMAQFPGMNENAFQKIAMADGQSLTGSNVFTATTTTGVGCSDGSIQNHYRNTILHQPDRRSPRSSTPRPTRSPAGPSAPRARASSPRTTRAAPASRTRTRDHLRRTRLRLEPLRELRAEPQRRDDVQVQRHRRQHRGQPVRGPGRLIHRITSSPLRIGGAGCCHARPEPEDEDDEEDDEQTPPERSDRPQDGRGR